VFSLCNVFLFDNWRYEIKRSLYNVEYNTNLSAWPSKGFTDVLFCVQWPYKVFCSVVITDVFLEQVTCDKLFGAQLVEIETAKENNYLVNESSVLKGKSLL
jgi:hypothetical protein